MRPPLRSRTVRALSIGTLTAVIVGLLASSSAFDGRSTNGTSIVLVVPTTPINALQRISATDLTTISVPRQALSALGANPVTLDQKHLVVGAVARTALSPGRVIDLSDLYGQASEEAPTIGADQALYTLPLPDNAYPLPSLIPDSYVDIYALIVRNDHSSSGVGQPSKDLDTSTYGSILVVSKAKVFRIGIAAITVVIPRRSILTLNLMRTIGAFSFAQVSPDATALDPQSMSPQQVREAYHVATR